MNIRNVFLPGLALLTVCILFSACDVINEKDGYTEPYQPPAEANGRKVLLEEYTGMRCVNCPAAAEEAHLLQQTFGEVLVVVSIHAGGFAVPSGIFQPDLRTEAGNEYYSHFGLAGTPFGIVSRKSHGGTMALSPAVWADALRSVLTIPSEISMEGRVGYKNEDRAFQCLIKVHGLQSGEELNLTLWLVEDNIITPQVKPGRVEHNYNQRHVLRSALNGTWGEKIVAEQNGEWSGVRSYVLPLDMVAEECSIVAFVTASSREEIVSVVNIPFAAIE